jgi:hypothetical protein
MNDQFVPLPWYLQPGSSPFWNRNASAGAATPGADPWARGLATTGSGWGILGNLAQPVGGVFGNLPQSLQDPATHLRAEFAGVSPWTSATVAPIFWPAPSPNGESQDRPPSQAPAGMNALEVDTTKVPLPPENGRTTPPDAPKPPRVPLYGPGDVLLPPPEPAPPPPPKDFRTWLRDALSDENVRYYAGPHLYETLRKLQTLAQLLPGSGMIQSMQDTSRAREEARAGNYGKAAADLATGTLNAALDWLPPAKLAIMGGMMARTFPWNRLPTAMAIEATGRSEDEIWRAAELEREAGGRWTFEIPDRGYRVRPDAGERTLWKPLTVAPLYEHHDHPGMRKAYPSLSDWRSLLSIEPLQDPYGFTDFARKQLVVSAPDLDVARSVGIHELKHLIDKLEGHPPGGSPKQFTRQGIPEREAYDLYMRLVGEVAARNAQHRLFMSGRRRRLRSPRSTESVPRDQQINLNDD